MFTVQLKIHENGGMFSNSIKKGNGMFSSRGITILSQFDQFYGVIFTVTTTGASARNGLNITIFYDNYRFKVGKTGTNGKWYNYHTYVALYKATDQ